MFVKRKEVGNNWAEFYDDCMIEKKDVPEAMKRCGRILAYALQKNRDGCGRGIPRPQTDCP